ncbi:hypothetical protein [Neobacillus sedimentimangrovi]
MKAIKSTIRPKLQILGDYFAPSLTSINW